MTLDATRNRLPERRAARRSGAFRPLGVIVAVVVFALVVIPIVWMLLRTFVPGGRVDLSAFGAVWHEPWLWSMLRDTIITVVISVALALVLGSLMAWLAERTNASLPWIDRLVPLLPLFMPPLASSIGWVLLGTPGPGILNVLYKTAASRLGGDPGVNGPFDIFTWPGVIALFTISMVPNVFLIMTAALRNLEPALEEASRTCGTGPIRTVFRVTLPALSPAVLSSALLIIASGFSLFSVPFIIGTQAGVDNLITRVVRMTTNTFPPELDQATVLGLLVVLIIGTSWYLQQRLLRSARHARLEGKTSSPSKVDLGWLKWVVRVLMVAYLFVSAVLPLVGLLYVSLQRFWSGKLNLSHLTLQKYSALFSSAGNTAASIRNSFVLAVLAATLTVVASTVVTYYGQRTQGSRLATAAEGVARLPAALSHVVVALAMIVAFAGPPLHLQGTMLLLLMGYCVIYLPQASISTSAALAQLGPTLSEASLISGATELRTFGRIVLPLMSPGLISGWVLVFVLTAGDLTASAMLSSPSTPVVGFTMLDLATGGTFGSVAALGCVVTLGCAVIGAAVLALGRRTGKALEKR